MNYIWDVPIQSQHQDVDLKEIVYEYNEPFSPYIELNAENLNQKELKKKNDVNPYFRFYSIFKELIDDTFMKYTEFRRVLFDLLIHFLARIDVNQGMGRIEYFKEFIHRDIKKGLLGENVKKGFEKFSLEEKIILLDNIYKFYKMGEHFYFLRRSAKGIYKDIIMYVKKKSEENKVILYINQEGNRVNKIKLDVIKELLLPINYELDVYWESHFGVVDVNRSLKIGEMAIY